MFATNMAFRYFIPFLIMIPTALLGQVNQFSNRSNLLENHPGFVAHNHLSSWRAGAYAPHGPRLPVPAGWAIPATAPFAALPAWSADALPFFCRVEHHWAKTARVPLKFRLGSVEYVDWLEGKRH